MPGPRAILVGQLTLEPVLSNPAPPGGHAKWVKVPRGAATVSGERIPRAGSAGGHCAEDVDPQSTFDGMGRQGMTRSIREPGYLTPGTSFTAS